MKFRWQLIPHETGEGKANLSTDALLLDQKAPFPILRFYSWASPCISYGYFQSPPPESNRLPAHRRVTGGGTVFHDRDLVYSLIYPRGGVLPWSLKQSYLEIHHLLQKALGRLAILTGMNTDQRPGRLCFQSPVLGDLLYKGRKVAGAAQRRKGNHLLHEGSVLVEELGVDRFRLIEAMIREFMKTYPITFRDVSLACRPGQARSGSDVSPVFIDEKNSNIRF